MPCVGPEAVEIVPIRLQAGCRTTRPNLALVFLLRPREQLRSIMMSMSVSVCLSFCLFARISPEPYARYLPKFFMHVAYGHGSVLLRRRCAMLCTSGFVDESSFIMGHIAI